MINILIHRKNKPVLWSGTAFPQPERWVTLTNEAADWKMRQKGKTLNKTHLLLFSWDEGRKTRPSNARTGLQCNLTTFGKLFHLAQTSGSQAGKPTGRVRASSTWVASKKKKTLWKNAAHDSSSRQVIWKIDHNVAEGKVDGGRLFAWTICNNRPGLSLSRHVPFWCRRTPDLPSLGLAWLSNVAVEKTISTPRPHATPRFHTRARHLSHVSGVCFGTSGWRRLIFSHLFPGKLRD